MVLHNRCTRAPTDPPKEGRAGGACQNPGRATPAVTLLAEPSDRFLHAWPKASAVVYGERADASAPSGFCRWIGAACRVPPRLHRSTPGPSLCDVLPPGLHVHAKKAHAAFSTGARQPSSRRCQATSWALLPAEVAEAIPARPQYSTRPHPCTLSERDSHTQSMLRSV